MHLLALDKEELREIIKWMKISNAAQSQESYEEKLTAPGTGEWFLHGNMFDDWKQLPNSLLWLKGAGKLTLIFTLCHDSKWKPSWCREECLGVCIPKSL